MRSGSVILAAVAMLTGCSGIADDAPPLEKYGAVNFLGKRTGSNTASAVTTVVFFEAVGLQIPNSSLQQTDQCVFSPVDTLPTAARGDRKAGSAIGITVGGSTRQLTYVDAEQRYITPVGQPIRYAVGDVGQVTVPGDGAAQISQPGRDELCQRAGVLRAKGRRCCCDPRRIAHTISGGRYAPIAHARPLAHQPREQQ